MCCLPTKDLTKLCYLPTSAKFNVFSRTWSYLSITSSWTLFTFPVRPLQQWFDSLTFLSVLPSSSSFYSLYFSFSSCFSSFFCFSKIHYLQSIQLVSSTWSPKDLSSFSKITSKLRSTISIGGVWLTKASIFDSSKHLSLSSKSFSKLWSFGVSWILNFSKDWSVGGFSKVKISQVVFF